VVTDIRATQGRAKSDRFNRSNQMFHYGLGTSSIEPLSTVCVVRSFQINSIHPENELISKLGVDSCRPAVLFCRSLVARSAMIPDFDVRLLEINPLEIEQPAPDDSVRHGGCRAGCEHETSEHGPC
jgi:hypothetical protein